MRILLVRVTSMGDVVLTLPVVNDILKNVPNAKIDWLVEKPFAWLPRLHPGVSKVIEVEWRKWRHQLWKPEVRAKFSAFRRNLREHHYDIVIDCQGQLAKSVVLAWQARGPLSGFAWQGLREPLSSLAYAKKAQVSKTVHLVPRSRALCAQLLGYPRPTEAPSYGIKTSEAFWRPSAKPYAILIPNASRIEKLWPHESWVAIGRQIQAAGLDLGVFWGSEEEQVRAQALADTLGATVPPFLKVGEAASVLANARLVVGLDTGFTHLAAALERPTIGIYCDFDPNLAGVVGAAYCASVGGVGQVPSVDEVEPHLTRILSELSA